MRSEWSAAAVALRKAKAKEQTTFVPLGEWRPDVAEFPVGQVSPYLQDAKGVIPTDDGYAPLEGAVLIADPVEDSSGVSANIRGMGSFKRKDGSEFHIVGSLKNLFKMLPNGTWSTVTRTSGDYALNNGPTGVGYDRWTFGQFVDSIIALCLSHTPQVMNMSSAVGFSDMSGSPPNAKYGVKFRNQYVLMNLSTGNADMIACRIGDLTQWDGDGTGGSWSVTLESGGAIQGAYEVAGSLYVFQQSAIRRIDYVGDQFVVNIQTLIEGHGCAVPWTLATWGSMAFYLAQDGLYQFSPATGPIPIGQGKFDKWLMDDFDLGSTPLRDIVSIVDPYRNLYILGFERGSSGSDEIALVYHWPTQRASYLTRDDGYGGLGGSTDDVYWAIFHAKMTKPTTALNLFNAAEESFPVLVASSNDGRLAVYSASEADIASVFETGDCQFAPGRRAQVLRVVPEMDLKRSSGDEVAIGARVRYVYGGASDGTTTTDISTQNNDNIAYYPQRSGRFVRFYLETSDLERRARGLWVTWRDAGKVL